MNVDIKRVYEEPASSDGFRVLVDRLWPRGVSRERVAFDLWLKGVAPSPELRTWFGHKPERFDEFSARYKLELGKNPTATQLLDLAKKHKKVTLLYAARDPKVNHVVVLKDYLGQKN